MRRIAPHETFELHELLTMKNISATMASAMAALVKDEELRTLLQQDFTMSQGQIRELVRLLGNSELLEENAAEVNRH